MTAKDSIFVRFFLTGLNALNLKKYPKPHSVPSFLIQRFLVYNYSSPYGLRDAIYHVINLFSSRLNKYVLPRRGNESLMKMNSELSSQGVALNVCDISSAKALCLLDALSTMRQKSVRSAKGDLQKIVYSQVDLTSNLDFLSLACSKHVVELATEYLGVPPIIAYLSAWKTVSSGSEVNEMFFHMDHHGHKFLKLFYYLNHVEIGCGHHEYCSATHKQDHFDRLIKERDNKNHHFRNAIYCKRKFGGGIRLDNALINDFIPEKVLKIGGKAGTSFIEDTRGLHRGTLLPDGYDRTIFQVLYLPNRNYKDKPLGLVKNQALEKCYVSSGVHSKVLDRLFSNLFK